MSGKATALLRREWLAFGAALLIVIAVAAVWYRSASAAEEALARAAHTGDVLARIDDMNADLARSATARRAYVIAGDRSQVANVAELDARLRASLRRLGEAVADNPEQSRRVAELARVIDERLRDLDASIERRDRTGAAADDPGEILLGGRHREIREAMTAEEIRLLSERNARTADQLSRSQLAGAAGLALSVIIFAASFHRMRREIERRRRSEAERARQEAFLETIVESMPDTLLVKDADLRIERINRAGEQLLGRSREEVLGRPERDVLPGAAAEAAEAQDRRALAAGAPLETEDAVRGDEGERWLRTKRVPLLDESGRAAHLLRISEDITESRTMIETLREAKSAAEAANEELRRARAEADAANHAKSEFLSSMSHEVRTPLNAILGFAQLLQRDRKEPLSKRHADRVERILASGDHLLRLIDDILDLARIEAGRIPLSKEPVSLDETLAEVKASLDEMAGRFQVNLNVPPITAEVPRVSADRTRLAQILLNFGSNAIKYNRPSGSVTFSASLLGAWQVRVSVRDTGPGIAVARQDQLFQPFQRAGQENGPIEGTGIGLVVTKRLAEAMGGSVGFSSAPGEGSEFWVNLPVH